jgi:DNA repair protein RecO
VLIVFQRKLGRLTVFAKGVKDYQWRSPHLQTGNLIDIIINHKNDHYYLQESRLISGFSELKKDENKIKQLYLFLFVLDRILPEQQKETRIYNRTKNFLIDLSKSSKKNILIVKYLTDIMMLLGYLDKKIGRAELRSLIEEIINEKIPPLIYN